MITDRRSFLRGLLAVGVAAPAIVRAASLMPIRGRVLLTGNVTYWVNGFNDEPGEGTMGNPWRTIQQAMDHINRELDLNGHDVTVQLDGFCEAGKIDLGRHVSFAVDGGFCDLSGGEIAFDGDRNIIEVRDNSYLNLRDLTLNAREPVETGPLIRGDMASSATVGFVERDIVTELNGWSSAIERSARKVKQ